jgi:hypothetical protein
MSWAIVVVAVLAIILSIWQTIQIQAVRKKVDAVPEDGNTVMMLQDLDGRSRQMLQSIGGLDQRLASLEGRFPNALTRFGVVEYDAFGNIAGNQSRSIAILSEAADGLVITPLTARDETIFYTKEVRGGRGVQELSPEEQASVDRAMGR